MPPKIIVLGGGVGGLSAAHELSERGYAVEVYERKAVPGGKARSIAVPNTAKDGRRPLPGEHGFRFFPGFYRHLPDTMRRIPYAGRSVLDNLVSTTRDLMTVAGAQPLVMLPRFPTSVGDLKSLFELIPRFSSTGLTDDDLQFFAGKMWQILTSCGERRLNEYGRVGWWSFIDAGQRSKAYQDFLAIGATRTLVASQAELANTRTVGDIGWQLLLNMLVPGDSSDRVLNGPTNDVWIDPWVAHLRGNGVAYNLDSVVQRFHVDRGRIAGVTVSVGGTPRLVVGDHYISALPVEVMAGLVDAALIDADPVFGTLARLATQVRWMSGIQYYLKSDVAITHGHQVYPDTLWALSSISQQQFWPGFDLSTMGDGQVRGVLSVDISDWDVPGLAHGPAKLCTRQEIADETWLQLKQSLNIGGQTLLDDDNIHSWFLDDSIQPDKGNPHQQVNLEPLLVNLIDSWDLRPDAWTELPNLYLASDYVRTNTDLATMEGANEAARRAVNAILDATDSGADRCEIWPLHEPDLTAPLRWLDRRRYEQGLRWADPARQPGDWLKQLRNRLTGLLGG